MYLSALTLGHLLNVNLAFVLLSLEINSIPTHTAERLQQSVYSQRAANSQHNVTAQ